MLTYGSKILREHFTLDTLRNHSSFSKEGVSLLGISEAAESIGFRASGVKLTYEQIINDAQLPCIIHWRQNHFVVLTPQPNLRLGRKQIQIADPAKQTITTVSKKDFLQKRNDKLQ